MAYDLRNPQLFLDDRWIADAHRVQRVWQQAQVYPEPVVRPTQPWEGHQIVLFGTVIQEEGFRGFRMYYTTFNPPEPPVTCLAVSDDGIQWRKPRLGLCEWHGSKDNNIVLTTPRGNDGTTLAYDPDAEYPYLLYFFMGHDPAKHTGWGGGIHIARSKDGINFEHVEEAPVLPRTGDRNNIMLRRVNGKFVLLCRHRDMGQMPGSRSIWISESEDGYRFTEPELVLARDLNDAPLVEYYGMTAFPYGDLYLGLLEYWHQRPDRIELVLGWSDDLRQWQLPPARQPFIGSKYPWNENWNSPSSAPPILVGDQLWFYIGGRSGAHGASSPHSYGAVGLASLRADRFCALTADALFGRVVTQPMVWPGGDLLLNASTTRYHDSHPGTGGGEMRVEVLDAEWQPIAEFSGESAAPFRGNQPSRGRGVASPLRWGEKSLDALRGQTIRLYFYYRDAHLYSFRAGRD